jgi:hypothetical protein
MQDSFKTFRELLAERGGRGFSEQFLTEVLRSVLPELVMMHATQRAHGGISPDTLIQNPQTLQAGLKPPLEEVHGDRNILAKDLDDLGVTIITLLTGKRPVEMLDKNGHCRWQDERLVSDNFAIIINKATSKDSDLKYSNAMAMLNSLDTERIDTILSPPKDSSSIDLTGDSRSQLSNLLEGNTIEYDEKSRLTKKSALYLLAITSAILATAIAVLFDVTKQRDDSNKSLTATTPIPDPYLTINPVTSNTVSRTAESTNINAYLTGISLPITNTLCNKKRSFCIYNLAKLINQGSGQATYSFSEMQNGEQVNIKGVIEIANLKRNGDNRTYTFSFSDDQNNTTPGWAAAGSFKLDQDNSRPGILTSFKTHQSFGPKTPVGLENTAYLFPQ